jgi:hypothetical protein
LVKIGTQLFWDLLQNAGRTPTQWDAYCRGRGFLVFAAERGGELLGYAVAVSHPRAVHLLDLEGDAATCRLLLDRLVRAAGERDLTAWVPAERRDVRRLLRGLGFTKEAADVSQGQPMSFYSWDRSGDG